MPKPKQPSSRKSIRDLPSSANLSKLLSDPKLGLQHLLQLQAKDLDLTEPKKETEWLDWLVEEAKQYGPQLMELLPELLALL
jgi:hypothetical protein